MVYMDQNGDAEGNYTLLVRKPHHIFPQQFGLYPVGVFTLQENENRLLVSTRCFYVVRSPPH
jgi:atrial natriuretic peptide receptor A